MTAESLPMHRSDPPRRAVPRPGRVSLKRSLMSRIVVVGLACFGLVMAIVLLENRLETRQLEEDTAERVARHLELQLLRIESNLDIPGRFPDWDIVVSDITASGQCVRFEDESGRMLRNSCVGSVATRDRSPQWFAASYDLLFPRAAPAARAVTFKGRSYGTVSVSTDRAAAVDRVWRGMRQMLTLTAITVLTLCILSYFAIERALAPTKEVVAGLNRLARGDFSTRLPDFRHSELQRIGEVSNQLAEKIEATLAERAQLSKRLMNAQEQERRHLARELHDEFAQNLTAISALAAALERSAENHGAELRDEARTLSQISQRMMSALRGTLLHLRPAELDKFGLVESLRQLVEVWNRSSGGSPRFELDAPGEIAPLSDEAAVHVFRIAQEGLTNAAKHSDAGRVRLSLAPVSAEPPGAAPVRGIALTIEDDGAGRREQFDEAARDGRGLLNMRERVAALGGSIDFEDRPGAGLRVRVVIPIGDSEGGAR